MPESKILGAELARIRPVKSFFGNDLNTAKRLVDDLVPYLVIRFSTIVGTLANSYRGVGALASFIAHKILDGLSSETTDSLGDVRVEDKVKFMVGLLLRYKSSNGLTTEFRKLNRLDAMDGSKMTASSLISDTPHR